MKNIKPSPSYTARLAGAIREGLADADAGRLISDEELGRQIEIWFRSKPDRK